MRFYLIIFLAISSVVLAANMNVNMNRISQLISSSLPVIYSETKLNNSKEREKVIKNFSKIKQLFQESKQHLSHRGTNYRLSYEVAMGYLDEGINALKNNNLVYAQHLLSGTPSLCVSCHTQDNISRSGLWGLKADQFQSSYSYAEYLFMTRRYESSLRQYLRFVRDSLAFNKTQQVEKAITRIAQMSLQEKDMLKKVKIEFEQLSRNKKIPVHIRKKFEEWLLAYKNLSLQKIDVEKEYNFKQIDALIKKNFPMHSDDSNFINYPAEKKLIFLSLSKVLHHYLVQDAKKNEIPYLLYWIALAERPLKYNLFFSVPDQYLKECFVSHSEHDVAKDCYKEYKKYVIFSHSGSSGVNLPDDVKSRIKKWDKQFKIDYKKTM